MVKAFEITGLTQKPMWKTRFGGLYRAFQYGAPPHGGMAAGIDRMVMLLVGAKNLREISLFPMNQQANDLLMGAPATSRPSSCANFRSASCCRTRRRFEADRAMTERSMTERAISDMAAPLRRRFIARTQDILDSYRRHLGHDLIARSGDVEDEAARLFAAPFVVLSQGTEADPVLNYGNAIALQLWEMQRGSAHQSCPRVSPPSR